MSNPSPGFARNPAKSITVEAFDGDVTVSAGGSVVARTSRALRLTEPPYPAMLYIPYSDIDFSKLAATAQSTHCPYKGDASYWSVLPAGERGTNAMWAYENPFDEMSVIKDHGAFYADRVTIDVC